MNIFIGFGYNNDDKWIKELVFPLLESFDANIITGEDMHGEVLSEEVIKRIKKADGMLAFLTRRDRMENGNFTTHRWVHDELVTALNNKIPVIEIRENKVDRQGGITGDREYIPFDIDNKAKLLADLSKPISIWRKKSKARYLLLLPRSIAKQVIQNSDTDNVKCTYRFSNRGKVSDPEPAKLIPLADGVSINVANPPSEESYIQVSINGPKFSWSSSFVPIRLPITLTSQKK
jgi:hypothetical protein